MAHTSLTSEAFDDHVRVVDAMLSDIAALADEWPALSVLDRVTAAHEWSEAMARLEHLASATGDDHPGTDRRATLDNLRLRLQANLQLAEHLGLYDPRARSLADVGLQV